MDINTLSLKKAVALLKEKKVSSVEITQEYLKAIQAQDPTLHAYLEVFDDALGFAKIADEHIASGQFAPLTGVPIAIKDNILIQGKIASAGSKMLGNYRASYNAGVTEKVLNAGGVFLGRTNMDEFALGGSTENSAYGPTKNPRDTGRVPGGTSGGSAAAVAGHLAVCALGTDTGGSIRQPASFCGVVGLKPTYGRVSRFGVIATASSLDQVGILTKDVDDAELLFDVIRGHDGRDSTSLPDTFFDKQQGRNGKKIGVPRNFLSKGVDPDILTAFEHKLSALKVKGYEIIDVDLPSFAHALAAYYIINPAEVSSNLSRFDGIRYGFSEPAADIRAVYEQSRGIGFGPESRRRILVGAFVLSSGYVDAYYRKAQAVRSAMRAEVAQLFESIDYIVTPTTPTPAYKFGEKEDLLAMYAGDIFTVPVNLTGVPAISVPMGTVVRDGASLPIGLQVIARHGGESQLFAIGKDIEQV